MQNYPVGYQPQIQTQTVPVQTNSNATGATFNIGNGAPNAIPANSTNGVTINIMGASVNPNGANINNTYNTTTPAAPGQSYDKSYYLPQQPPTPTVPVAASSLNDKKAQDKPKKDVVLLTDEYIKTLENYIRNDNPELKLMGAKELMKRFREDDSRKTDPALTSLLNLLLQSKYSNVKMVGMGILQNGWAQGDALTQHLLSQIQQTSSAYGLDAIDAAQASLKTAGQTVKIVDTNPPKEKQEKNTEKFDKAKYE